MEEYQGLLENNGLVGYAQEVLKETDQSCFVQTAKQLHVRIQKATESLKSFRPAAQTSFEDYVVNTSKQTELLGELSFFSSALFAVFSFLFDEKCGYNNEHLLLNLKRDRVESRAGFNLLLAAERIQVGYYTSLDYIIGDVGITKGKHFWAFRVEPYSYLVKAGVASSDKLQEWLRSPRDAVSPRYEQDSGHDSGSEDTCFDSSQPFTLVTIGMKKFFIPKSPTSSNEPENRVLPMPTSIGVLLDCDKGRVAFYDVDHMKCLYERQVDCSHAMYPAFALMGSGGVQLEESITAKYLGYQESM
ncbi:TRIM36 [Cervus elaphus hippelaphus]|uniref:TRIM36 n=1 Tax=Cervus elaphus hippelaphus TaxID=46360 RepID=A0A212CU67_CEREH|nr:TRIM36 [Cervus elaphus hippelaphus]